MVFSSQSSIRKRISSQPLRSKSKGNGAMNPFRSQRNEKHESTINVRVQNKQKPMEDSDFSASNGSGSFIDCVSSMNAIFNLTTQSQNSSDSQVSNMREESEVSIQQGDDESISNQASLPSQVTTKTKKLSHLRDKISGLEQRKNLLSEFDTTGAIVRSLIDITKELLDLIDEDNLEYESHLNYFLVQPDPTYKNSRSNRIYVEGTLPLDLDSYEKAIRRARFKTPGSFAYQIIKFAFPEIYYANVILGKKEMSELEFNQKVTQKKKPLAYVLGFLDPLDKPFQGQCCMKRGEKRIRALIDHIFRKSGRLEYTTADEMKVRSRIIKELSRKNNGSGDNMLVEHKSVESNDEDSFKSVNSEGSNDDEEEYEDSYEY